MRRVFFTRVFLFAILIIGVLYILLYKNQPVATPDEVNISDTVSESREVRYPPEGMLEYRNAKYHLSLFYPQELEVKERPERGNAVTITFQNVGKGLGFQIFIVPYSEQQISEARFKKDVPSGVKTDLENVTIDGVTAATFYSKDISLGETREIWFIKNNFLYEVTTPRSLDEWLSSIMRSWHFMKM